MIPKVKTGPFSWKKRGQAFRYAYKGIRYAFTTQHNMWLHALAAVLAIILGCLLHISGVEWLTIILCIALVMSLEIINTAIEVLVDHIHPDHDPVIGLVKDLAAGAVLVAAIFSFFVGCWIFIPPISNYLHLIAK